MDFNLGNVVGLIVSDEAPAKTYVLWSKPVVVEGETIYLIKAYKGATLGWQTIGTGGGGGTDLSGTLTEGNVTAGNNIVLTEGDKIVVGNVLGVYSGLAKGSYDTARGGDKGVSLLCGVGMELNFQAGYLRHSVAGSSTPVELYTDSELIYTSGIDIDNPSSDYTLTTKKYLEDKVTLLLPKSGGTMTGNLLMSGGSVIDSTLSGGSDVLNIGTSNADIINIGWSGSTVNIYGAVYDNQVTELRVKDKLFTVNKGGGAASGFSSGFEIEEDGSATGWLATNGARTGWDFKAPASFQFTLLLSSLAADRIWTVPNYADTFLGLSHSATLYASLSGSYANPSWITSLAESKVLPSQATHSGKFLTTNGTSTSWVTVAGSGDMVLATSGQVVTGSKIFSTGTLVLRNTLGTFNATLLTTAIAARNYTFPDIGVDGTVALLQGNQTFTSNNTFTGSAASGASVIVNAGANSSVTNPQLLITS